MEIDKISERFNQVAEKYDEQRKLFIPCFDDYYGTSISFLTKIKNNFKYILDLGAGTGLLTKFLYEKFPKAQYTLLDISNQMLDIARQRFKGLSNFSYSICDYSKELPSKQFDLIASALSIHHLENADKEFLYTNIYNKLNKNGFFINLDQFNASSELMNKYFNDYWYESIDTSKITNQERESWLKRRELDKENTIEETKNILFKVGFKTVECIYSYLKFGVIIAKK